MKFCKNLQRVVDISDPEWAPYWTNYKMLKKLIKELPSLVPAHNNVALAAQQSQQNSSTRRPDSPCCSQEDSSSNNPRQHHGDKTAEQATTTTTTSSSSNIGNRRDDRELSQSRPPSAEATAAAAASTENVSSQQQQQQQQRRPQQPNPNASAALMGKSPGEIAFFKLLHSEFKKTTHFFERAQQEFIIREERVREGMDIIKQPNSIMVNEKWSLLAKSIFRLYKDLLLLETFCIMTYCSFSKILKKHDKVTGFSTRNAFMANVVNKANFTNYPKVMEMINRCEQLYEEVSEHLLREGKEGLYEDERLFINMIHRLNEQALDTAGHGGSDARKEKIQSGGSPKLTAVTTAGAAATSTTTRGVNSEAVKSLQSLVEENDRKKAGEVEDGDDSDDAADGGPPPTDVLLSSSSSSPPIMVSTSSTTTLNTKDDDDDGAAVVVMKRSNSYNNDPSTKRPRNA